MGFVGNNSGNKEMNMRGKETLHLGEEKKGYQGPGASGKSISGWEC